MYHHTAIPVIDLEESQSFYERLGFVKLREWNKPEEELSAVVIQKDGFTLELIYHPTHQVLIPSPITESRHIGISVPELENLLTELEDDGVTILKPITKGVSVKEFCFIADPSGNVIELVVEK
jgi:catechol 2,3-dioxygenase-like lactoylglutathione lyase family enzyme